MKHFYNGDAYDVSQDAQADFLAKNPNATQIGDSSKFVVGDVFSVDDTALDEFKRRNPNAQEIVKQQPTTTDSIATLETGKPTPTVASAQPKPFTPHEHGAVETFTEKLMMGLVPAATGALGAIAAGTVTAPTGPGAVAGALAGAAGGSYAGSKAQEWALKHILGEQKYDELKQQIAYDEQKHGIAAGMGGLVPMFVGTKGLGMAKGATIAAGKKVATKEAIAAAQKAGQEISRVPEIAKAAATTAGRVRHAVATGSVLAGETAGEQFAQGEDIGKIVADIPKNIVAMGATGFFPVAKTALGAVGVRSISDSMAMALSNAIYDQALYKTTGGKLGKQFDISQLDDETLKQIPANTVMNAVSYALTHGMRKSSALKKSAEPSAREGTTIAGNAQKWDVSQPASRQGLIDAAILKMQKAGHEPSPDTAEKMEPLIAAGADNDAVLALALTKKTPEEAAEYIAAYNEAKQNPKFPHSNPQYTLDKLIKDKGIQAEATAKAQTEAERVAKEEQQAKIDAAKMEVSTEHVNKSHKQPLTPEETQFFATRAKSAYPNGETRAKKDVVDWEVFKQEKPDGTTADFELWEIKRKGSKNGLPSNAILPERKLAASQATLDLIKQDVREAAPDMGDLVADEIARTTMRNHEQGQLALDAWTNWHKEGKRANDLIAPEYNVPDMAPDMKEQHAWTKHIAERKLEAEKTARENALRAGTIRQGAKDAATLAREAAAEQSRLQAESNAEQASVASAAKEAKRAQDEQARKNAEATRLAYVGTKKSLAELATSKKQQEAQEKQRIAEATRAEKQRVETEKFNAGVEKLKAKITSQFKDILTPEEIEFFAQKGMSKAKGGIPPIDMTRRDIQEFMLARDLKPNVVPEGYADWIATRQGAVELTQAPKPPTTESLPVNAPVIEQPISAAKPPVEGQPSLDTIKAEPSIAQPATRGGEAAPISTPALEERAQPIGQRALAEGKPAEPRTRDEIATDVDSVMAKASGKMASTANMPSVKGQDVLRTHISDDGNNVITFVHGMASVAGENGAQRVSGVTRGWRDKYGRNVFVVHVDPVYGDATTVAHEVGEIISFLAAARAKEGGVKFIPDANRVLQKVDGAIDLTTKEGGHQFAVNMETPQSRKNIADAFRNAPMLAREGMRGFLRTLAKGVEKLLPSKYIKEEWSWLTSTEPEKFANGLENFQALRLFSNPAYLKGVYGNMQTATNPDERAKSIEDTIAPKNLGSDFIEVPPAERPATADEMVQAIARDAELNNVKPLESLPKSEGVRNAWSRFKTSARAYGLRLEPIAQMAAHFGQEFKRNTADAMRAAYNRFATQDHQVMSRVINAIDSRGIKYEDLSRMQKAIMWKQTFNGETMEHRIRAIFKNDPATMRRKLNEYETAQLLPHEREAINEIQDILATEVFPTISRTHKLMTGQDLNMDLKQGEYGWFPYVFSGDNEIGEWGNAPTGLHEAMQSAMNTQREGAMPAASTKTVAKKGQAQYERVGGAKDMPVDNLLDGVERFVRQSLYLSHINPEVLKWREMREVRDANGESILARAIGQKGVDTMEQFYDVMEHNGGFKLATKSPLLNKLSRNITGSQLSASINALLVQGEPIFFGYGVNDFGAQSQAARLIMGKNAKARNFVNRASSEVRYRIGSTEEQRQIAGIDTGAKGAYWRLKSNMLAPLLAMDKMGYEANFLGAYITELKKIGKVFNADAEPIPELVAKAEEIATKVSASSRVVDKPLALTTGVTGLKFIDRNLWLTKLMTTYLTPTFFNQAMIKDILVNGDQKTKFLFAWAMAAAFSTASKEISNRVFRHERYTDKKGRVQGGWLADQMKRHGVENATADTMGYYMRQYADTVSQYTPFTRPADMYASGNIGVGRLPVPKEIVATAMSPVHLVKAIKSGDSDKVLTEAIAMGTHMAQTLGGVPFVPWVRRVVEERQRKREEREKSLGGLGLGKMGKIDKL